MKIKNNLKNAEIILGIILFAFFLVHILGLLDKSMMLSGFLVITVCAYIALLFQEKISDERDEYIRSKVDRYVFIYVISLLMLVIIYKTFTHIDYSYELFALFSISIIKLVLAKTIKSNN